MAIAAAARQNLAAPRPPNAIRDLGGVARRHRALRLLLPAHLRKNHLGLRAGRARAGRRPRRAHGAAGLEFYPPAVAADLGHHQHRHHRHGDLDLPGGAGGLLRGAQHHAERDLCAADRAVHHRRVALDQFADLGPDAGHHRRPRRVCRHHRHRPALDRLLRQAVVRGDRGDRRVARSKRCARPARVARRPPSTASCRR